MKLTHNPLQGVKENGMSLDIGVSNARTGESMDMNWLRNPYGLCQWAEDNFAYAMEREPVEEKSLWYVINHWNYDKSEQVDKPLFLEVVKRFGDVIMMLDRAYFWFTEKSFEQFIQPYLSVLPPSSSKEFKQYSFEGIVRYHLEKIEHIGIPMQYLGHSCFDLSSKYRPDHHTLDHYKNWYQELIKFAEMLQDPDAVFYCSN